VSLSLLSLLPSSDKSLTQTFRSLGKIDVHLELERDIAQFLRVPAAINYAQGFSAISSVIPAFCKRGDIVVADRGCNFAIQKGIQISRVNVKWYDHGDYESLERVLETIKKEDKKYRRNPTNSRRFIVTEGIFENDGSMVNLPKVVCSFLLIPNISRTI
jgi:serine palmitoyltransferase